MTNAEWICLLNLIPEEQHGQLVMMLTSGAELGIETLLRVDPSYIVFRGRALGNTDEGRVYFVPLTQIVYLNLNRYVREEEIHEIFNVVPATTPAPPPAALAPLTTTGSGQVPRLSPLPPLPRPAPADAPQPSPRPTPALPHIPPAPAAPVKSSILERLRAQRNPRTT